MITGINILKTLTKNISWECKCRFDGRNGIQINGRITIKNVKKKNLCEKDYTWNSFTCSCENGKYLANIIDNSVITCDEIKDADAEAKLNDEAKSNDKETKTVPKNKV